MSALFQPCPASVEPTRLPLTFVLGGAPRTKKNHGRRIKRGNRIFHVPSKAHEDWSATVQPQLAKVRQAVKGLPITADVNVSALFVRKTNVGDAVGFYQALADALEEGGILENDRQIVSWDGSRLLKHAENPRIIVTIQEAV